MLQAVLRVITLSPSAFFYVWKSSSLFYTVACTCPVPLLPLQNLKSCSWLNPIDSPCMLKREAENNLLRFPLFPLKSCNQCPMFHNASCIYGLFPCCCLDSPCKQQAAKLMCQWWEQLKLAVQTQACAVTQAWQTHWHRDPNLILLNHLQCNQVLGFYLF